MGKKYLLLAAICIIAGCKPEIKQSAQLPAKKDSIKPSIVPLSPKMVDHPDSVCVDEKDFDIVMKRPQRRKVRSNPEDVDYSELWIKYKSSGKEELLIAAQDGGDVNTVTDMYDLVLSPDKKELYFESDAYATCGMLHVLNLKTKKERAIVPTNYIDIITSGRYKGNLIINQHRYKDYDKNGDGGGAYDCYYIITPRGKFLKTLGDSNKEFGLSPRN